MVKTLELDKYWSIENSMISNYVTKLMQLLFGSIPLKPWLSQSRDRKRPCPEMFMCACATGSCATVSRVFSYSSTSTMATEGHSKGVRMRNRRLRTFHQKLATGSEGFPRFFLLTIVVQKVGWGVLYDVRVLDLAWLPELVIYPFRAILFSYNIYVV